MPDPNDATTPESKPSANSAISPAPKKDEESLLGKAANLAKNAVGAVAENVSNQLDSNMGDQVDEDKNDEKLGEESQQDKKLKQNQGVDANKKKEKNPMVEFMEELGKMVESINKDLYGKLYDKMDDAATFAIDKTKAGIGAGTSYVGDKVKEGASNLIDTIKDKFSGEKQPATADVKSNGQEMSPVPSSSDSKSNPLASISAVPANGMPQSSTSPKPTPSSSSDLDETERRDNSLNR